MNGSLWTISQEINLYLLFGALALLGLLTLRTVAAMLVCGSVLWVLTFSLPLIDLGQHWHFLFLAPYFAAGSACYFIRQRWGLDGRIAVAIIAILPLFAMAGLFKPSFILAAYPILWLATTDRITLPTFERAGDFSYGMYLWGWPLGQLMVTLLQDNASPASVFVATLPAAIAVGMLSWFLVEARAIAMAPVIEDKGARWFFALRRRVHPEQQDSSTHTSS